MESALVEKNLNGEFEFILHVIPPPMKLDWSTPRSLFTATVLNHLRKDKAPIGHLYVEFTVPRDTGISPKLTDVFDGARRVITGMSRKKMTVFESIKVVQGKRLGLGTFFHDFKGKLDSVSEAREEIAWAKRRNRHAAIRISISEEKTAMMFEFLKDWIAKGSFRHYSGGLKVDCGEGAGCAEFGMHFFSMALGKRATNPNWMRRVRVPHFLIGGGFAGQNHRVSMWNILKDGDRWAYGNEPHEVYSIPDPELIFDWISAKTGRTGGDIDLAADQVTWDSGDFVRTDFTSSYPAESLGSIQEQWTRVIDKN